MATNSTGELVAVLFVPTNHAVRRHGVAQAKANRSNKGNPASKRMSNKNLQARRERSWLAGKARRKAKDEAQQKRAADNRARRARGEATPWMIACTHRAARRHGVEPAT